MSDDIAGYCILKIVIHDSLHVWTYPPCHMCMTVVVFSVSKGLSDQHRVREAVTESLPEFASFMTPHQQGGNEEN
jgi:hypothetical protein